MKMDTLTAIKTRRAVRNWNDKDVSVNVLMQILEAGRWAPSPLNSHPWNFIVIKNKKTLADLAPKAKHGNFLTRANVVIVVTVDKKARVDEWLSEHEQHIYSGVGAIQNMWLAAWDLGLGGCWVTLDEKNSREILSIPDSHILLGSLALGYPKDRPQPHKETDRKPLSEMVTYETFTDSK